MWEASITIKCKTIRRKTTNLPVGHDKLLSVNLEGTPVTSELLDRLKKSVHAFKKMLVK